MFGYPKTYVMDVGWRKETEWHKLFPGVWKRINLNISERYNFKLKANIKGFYHFMN